MRLRAIGHVVAHRCAQHDNPSVAQFGVQLSTNTQQQVALLAPVIRTIASGVLDHPNPDVREAARTPDCNTGFAGVFDAFDRLPVDRFEGNVRQLHI